MRVIGVVAEFNPFHNGHEHLIRMAREQVGDKRAIVMVVMSGPFTQRGTPACLPPHIRARQALRCGADVVLELPFTFACAPSERFASGAIALLKSTGVVTDIAFGIDSDKDIIASIADFDNKHSESDEFSELIKTKLSDGKSYPAARAEAFIELAFNNGYISNEDKKASWGDALRNPNSILALEYIKAIKKYKAKYNIHMIQRVGAGYSDGNLDNEVPSATSIRAVIENSCKEATPISKLATELNGKMPDKALATMLSAYSCKDCSIIDINSYGRDIGKLISAGLSDEIAYSGDDLPNYIANTWEGIKTFDREIYSMLMGKLQTKHFTRGRIERYLTSSLVGQKATHITNVNKPLYIRVLGFNKDGRYCLKIMGKCAKLPIISNCSDFAELFSKNPLIENDARISDAAYNLQGSYLGLDPDYHWKLPPVVTK